MAADPDGAFLEYDSFNIFRSADDPVIHIDQIIIRNSGNQRAVECGFADRGNVSADDNLAEIRAAVKRLITDRSQLVGKNNICHLRAAFKTTVSDRLHGLAARYSS